MRILALVWALVAVAQARPPAFEIVLDGGGFTNERFVMKPIAATYANNYWQSKSDPRATRLVLASDYGHDGTELQISVPATGGVFTKDDEDRPDRNPYLRIDLRVLRAGSQMQMEIDRVEVVITRLDPPGGRIEGTLQGTVRAPGNKTVRITGSFSVVRIKDRVID